MQAKQVLAFAVAFAVQVSPADSGQRRGGLVRLTPGAESAQDPSADTLDADVWRARLTDADLDLREQAYEDALAGAASVPGLRSLLQEWAGRDADGQLAWTSRLLLRELESARSPIGLRAAPSFSRNGPGVGGWRMGAIEPDELLERLRAWPGGFAPLHGRGSLVPPAQGGAVPPAQVEQKSESFQLSVGPDGARCELTLEEDGESVQRTFEAESLDRLLEQNPELRERIRVQQSLGDSLGGLQAFPGLVDPNVNAFGLFRGWEPQSAREPLRTDILGVVAHPLGAEEARALGVDPGRGLVVERVEPGTIADALRIRRGHVLLELNGRALLSRDDISAALSERSAQGDLRLELLDRWGEPRSRVWKPVPEREGPPGAGFEASDPRRY